MEDAYGHLSNAYGKNPFDLDGPLQIMLRHFGGRVPDLSALGAFAGKELYELADYTDKLAPPEQVMWSIRGERVDDVWLNPAQRWALDRLFREFGVNRAPYRGGTWLEHYAAIYLVSDPGIACILTVTNQTAYALHKYGDESLRRYVPGLIGEEEAITYGATWFTEIQGGSDLGANRVGASQDGQGWRITGDTKYFASNAGLADLALVTARPANAGPGAKGLALFLVPKVARSGTRNFLVRRLKEKSATRSVPTGEVEFQNSEAYLLGNEREGVYYTLENLIVSRLANAFGALGTARKAYLEAYFYAQAREAFGAKLLEHPLVQRDLLDMEVALEGALALALKATAEFQAAWTDTPPYHEGYHYARLLTHIAKNVTADMAAAVTQTAMELHGGIGFLQEFPIERLHREALITPIWEGPSNIQALDLLEVIAKKSAHLTLAKDMRRIADSLLEHMTPGEEALAHLDEVLESLAARDEAEAQFFAKDTLNDLGHAIATLLLYDVAERQESPRFADIARLYATRFLRRAPYDPEVVRLARGLLDLEPAAPLRRPEGRPVKPVTT